MSAATAIVTGNDPRPEMAAEAVEQALARAALTHASGVLLFLTPEFARSAQAAVHAASRAGKCLQVAGGIAAGVANEAAWVFDRPAAAALVLGGKHGLGPGDPAAGNLVCIASDDALPLAWRDDARRCGLLFQDPLIKNRFPAWQHGRLAADHRSCVSVIGANGTTAVSTGLRRLGPSRCIDAANAYELETLDGMRAVDALHRELPPGYRNGAAGSAAIALQHLCALVGDDHDSRLPRLLPIVAANADGSLTLGDRVGVGEHLGFAIRQPIDAERELQSRLGELSAACPEPEFGLFFSCIGRGPYFYSGDDRDWALFRERFPRMPFLGAYGNGQIAPIPEPRGLQNCVVLNVFAD